MSLIRSGNVDIQSSIDDFHEDDAVIVGPMPLSKLRLEDSVDGKDDTDNILILRINDMVAPAEKPTH